MKKLVAAIALCSISLLSFSQDKMVKKAENKTDKMAKKADNKTDKMNKKVANSADTLQKAVDKKNGCHCKKSVSKST